MKEQIKITADLILDLPSEGLNNLAIIKLLKTGNIKITKYIDNLSVDGKYCFLGEIKGH